MLATRRRRQPGEAVLRDALALSLAENSTKPLPGLLRRGRTACDVQLFKLRLQLPGLIMSTMKARHIAERLFLGYNNAKKKKEGLLYAEIP